MLQYDDVLAKRPDAMNIAITKKIAKCVSFYRIFNVNLFHLFFVFQQVIKRFVLVY